MPTEDIIPVTFMGGTGGNFLCHLIISAKRNIQDIIELSKYGNAHVHSLKDIGGSPYGVVVPDHLKIDYILNKANLAKVEKPYLEKPYYTPVHLVDIALINSAFKKSIRITYDLDDIPEISAAFYGKNRVDARKTKLNINHSVNVAAILPRYTFNEKFKKIENMPNVLFVSWKELFKENIDDLIAKLSTFTSINYVNFSVESVIHWRTKTQYCIDTFMDPS
jgi:hypothetical protein